MTHIMIPKQDLIRAYCDEGKTTRQIGKERGVSGSTVNTWLRKYEIPLRSGGRQRPDISGQKFGNLLVIGQAAGCDYKHPAWQCLCDCGLYCKANSTQIYRGRICCDKCAHKKGGILNRKKGYKDICGQLWYSIKRGASSRGLPFNVTIEYVWDLYVQQNKKCALTGVDISLFYKMVKSTASLDRIDSTKGYIIGNLQWVNKEINFMKQELSETVFVDWCKKVAEHSEKLCYNASNL